MNAAVQRAFAWSGIAMIVLFFVGFGAVAGFIPPPSPKDSPEMVAQMLFSSRNRIRVGMLIVTFAAAFLVTWSAVMATQIRRIEGRNPVISMAVMGSGTIFSLEFIYLTFFWLIATFRTDRDIRTLQLLNDMAWVPYIGLVSTVLVQMLLIGVATLLDKRAQPIFPRWAGYANLWFAACMMPGSLNVFFHEGPFAWDGILAFWVVVVAFAVFMVMNTRLLLVAIRRQAIEEPDSHTAQPDVATLAADLAQVREQLALLKPIRTV